MSFLSQFDTHIEYIEGEDNQVAKALSRTTSSILITTTSTTHASSPPRVTTRNSVSHTYMDPPPCSSDSSPALLHHCGVTSLQANPGRTSLPVIVRMCSRRSTTTVILVFGQHNASSRIGSSGQATKTSENGPAPIFPASLQKSRATSTPHSSVSLHPQHASNVDIVGPLPPSRDMRYLLTCVDRYTRWPEVIPLPDISAETTARAFLSGWVSKFGASHTIITERGSQFESDLWSRMLKFLGINRNRTTAYHPQDNGLVDSDVAPSQLVYAEILRLPGEIATPAVGDPDRYALHSSRRPSPTPALPPPRTPQSKSMHVPPALAASDYVFVRRDSRRTPLQCPYDGPFKVISRSAKHFLIDRDAKPDRF
ncbi:uncharacterized protein LOC143021616 [Oratosquilla oratoria]|uniref:uncharacterized protein LOC143021616 n=1 Tax=Oratosquilla oratoria TaxID=337810 RepID=UPI003F76438A